MSAMTVVILLLGIANLCIAVHTFIDPDPVRGSLPGWVFLNAAAWSFVYVGWVS